MRMLWRLLKRGLFWLAVILGGTIAAILLLSAFPFLVDILNAGPLAVMLALFVVWGVMLLLALVHLLKYGRLPNTRR